MKVEAEINLYNTALNHCRFLCSGTSLILKVVQGDTVHCVQNNILSKVTGVGKSTVGWRVY